MLMFYRLCNWVGRLTGTIIFTPHTYAVGNCAEEVYFGLLQARRENKKLVILYPYELPWPIKFGFPNIEIVNLESEYRLQPPYLLTIVGRSVITVYFALFRSLSLFKRYLTGRHLNDLYRMPRIGALTLWHPSEVMPDFSWDVVDGYDWPEQLRKSLHVSISKKNELLARKARQQMGLPENVWYVCLHVRESGFRDSKVYKEGELYKERNANILNYVDAIEEITSRGGWVVRMGDRSMTRLPKMEQVIDYPFTEQKNALMDVYLISQCRFYIGMMSGIYSLAELLQRPMITMNLNNWLIGSIPLRGNLAIFKHVYSKSRNRFLSVREWLDEPFTGESLSGSAGEDYVLYENTAEELKAVVVEYLDRETTWGPTELQKQFADLRVRRGKEVLGNEIFPLDVIEPEYRDSAIQYDLTERYRWALRQNASLELIGAEFLKHNLDYGQMGRNIEISPK
jgi:putative glycosyltransferase (TIGR04372 family)